MWKSCLAIFIVWSYPAEFIGKIEGHNDAQINVQVVGNGFHFFSKFSKVTVEITHQFVNNNTNILWVLHTQKLGKHIHDNWTIKFIQDNFNRLFKIIMHNYALLKSFSHLFTEVVHNQRCWRLEVFEERDPSFIGRLIQVDGVFLHGHYRLTEGRLCTYSLQDQLAGAEPANVDNACKNTSLQDFSTHC